MNIRIEYTDNRFKVTGDSEAKCRRFVEAILEYNNSLPARKLRTEYGLKEFEKMSLSTALTDAKIYIDGVPHVLAEDMTHSETGDRMVLFSLVEAGAVDDIFSGWTEQVLFDII